MKEEIFRFKQFNINQDQCAMKVGTDGVLLGAWATLDHNPYSVLDIGAGSGLIALMLAQRSASEVIDAIEIDSAAYEQCVQNFEESPWGDRLFCYHASLVEFIEEIDESYDLIVSNPPFYSEDYKSGSDQRDLARFNDAMPFEHLLIAASKFLSENGRFCVILPFKEESSFIDLAVQFNLHPQRIMRVKGHSNSEVKRSLLEFSFLESTPEISEMTIEISRHNYTQEYIDLTKDFYLNMNNV